MGKAQERNPPTLSVSTEDDATRPNTPRDDIELNSPPSLAQTSTGSSFSVQETPRNQIIPSKDRERLAREFIANRCPDVEYDELDNDGQLRAKRLMSKDFSWRPSHDGQSNHHKTTFKEQYDLFRNRVGHVFDDNVFFAGEGFDKAFEDYLVIRRQRAGLCYMHAVTVFQHYVDYIRRHRVKNDHENDHSTLDISWYIRECFAPTKLEKFLRSSCGGGSVDFFCEITGIWPLDIIFRQIQCKSKDETKFRRDIEVLFLTWQQQREPALVSRFAVEERFQENGKFVYDYEVDTEKFFAYAEKQGKPSRAMVLHSMVLIGMRKDDKSGKYWFLLQNFWPTKYLVVVSGEYMASCRALITFAPDDENVSLKNNLTVVNAHYSETETELEETRDHVPDED